MSDSNRRVRDGLGISADVLVGPGNVKAGLKG